MRRPPVWVTYPRPQRAATPTAAPRTGAAPAAPQPPMAWKNTSSGTPATTPPPPRAPAAASAAATPGAATTAGTLDTIQLPRVTVRSNAPMPAATSRRAAGVAQPGTAADVTSTKGAVLLPPLPPGPLYAPPSARAAVPAASTSSVNRYRWRKPDASDPHSSRGNPPPPPLPPPGGSSREEQSCTFSQPPTPRSRSTRQPGSTGRAEPTSYATCTSGYWG